MYCKKCGAKVSEGSAFCGRCGTRIRPASGAGAADKGRGDKPGKSKKPKKSGGSKVLIILAIVLGALVILGTGAFLYWRFTPGQTPEPVSPAADTGGTSAPDADAYYAENGEVLEVLDAADSPELLTEAEAVEKLRALGFTGYPVYTDYSMEEVYPEPVAVSESSGEVHPSYETYYLTENGELWLVMFIDGDILADPLWFNADSPLEAQLILSESETVTSYDVVTQRFFKTVPKDSALLIRVVDAIDARTLDSLTAEELKQS